MVATRHKRRRSLAKINKVIPPQCSLFLRRFLIAHACIAHARCHVAHSVSCECLPASSAGASQTPVVAELTEHKSAAKGPNVRIRSKTRPCARARQGVSGPLPQG